MKVIELFAGIGAPRQALKNLNISHEVVAISEIDDYAIKAYTQLHGETLNLGDISKIEILPDCDMVIYGFPCQDISIAGKQAGLIDGERSNLLWQVKRLIAKKQPHYLIMENVKNLLGPANKNNFQLWVNYLSTLGYVSTYQIMKAWEHGQPQHRERVIMVSILNGPAFEFPKARVSCPTLANLLEPEVDSLYYINASFDIDATKINAASTNKMVRIGQYGNGSQGERVYSIYGLSATLTVSGGGRGAKTGLYFDGVGIRKLTPLEAFRLMGFTQLPQGFSNTQLYKFAGNSIPVGILEDIFKKLFEVK